MWSWPPSRPLLLAILVAGTLVVVTGAVLATVFILEDEERDAEDEVFEQRLVPLVDQSLTEVEIFFEELVSFHQSIARALSATYALVDGFPRRAAVEQLVELSDQGLAAGRDPSRALTWNPIETPETIDEAVLFKQRHGFPDFQIRPPGNRSIYVPVYSIFPPTSMNLPVVGFDLWASDIRRAALTRARNSGMSVLTVPLDLLPPGEGGGRGILLFSPVYRLIFVDGVPQFDDPGSVQLRQERVAGYLGSVVVARRLFGETLSQALDQNRVEVCLFDKRETGQPSIDENLLAPDVTNLVGCWPDSPVNSLNGTLRIEDPMFPLADTRWQAVREIDVLGKRWVALISGTNIESDDTAPPAIIVAIVVISVLALVLLIGGSLYASALRRTIASARAARVAAEETARAKSAFLAHISHELRTPLNGVVGMIEVALADPNVPHQTGTNLKVARDSANVLLDVINDVLHFSKAESGNMRIESIAFAVDALLVSTMRMHVLQTRAKGIEFVLRLDRAVPAVVISDALRIRQILTNLLGNAVKFTDVGSVRLHCDVASLDDVLDHHEPRIQAWTESMEMLQESASESWIDDQELLSSGIPQQTRDINREMSQKDVFGLQSRRRLFSKDISPDERGAHVIGTRIALRFRVIDTGIGFTFKDAEQMFAPFIQADVSTTRIYGGTGLGLAISAQLASLLGGQLMAASRGPAQGSCFEFTVPVMVGSTTDLQEIESPSSSNFDAGLNDTSSESLDHENQGNGALVHSLKTEQPEDTDTRVRALIVDDNLVNLKVFSLMLNDIANVETATDGRSAVEVCIAKASERGWPPYNIVLIDMSMPIMDGKDATREIRRLEQEYFAKGGDRMTILLVSASVCPIEPALFDGALWKPVRRQDLRYAVVNHTQA